MNNSVGKIVDNRVRNGGGWLSNFAECAVINSKRGSSNSSVVEAKGAVKRRGTAHSHKINLVLMAIQRTIGTVVITEVAHHALSAAHRTTLLTVLKEHLNPFASVG